MAESISFPFRIAANGRVATVEAGSVDAEAEQVAALVLTRPGERALVPAFGTSDPAFDSVSAAELSAGLAMFGPSVTIVDIAVAYPTSSTQLVQLTLT